MATPTNSGWQPTKGKPERHYTLNNDKGVAVSQVYPSRKDDQGQQYSYTIAQRNVGHQGFHADSKNYNLTLGSALERGEFHRDRFQETEQQAVLNRANEEKFQNQSETSQAQVSQENGLDQSGQSQEAELER